MSSVIVGHRVEGKIEPLQVEAANPWRMMQRVALPFWDSGDSQRGAAESCVGRPVFAILVLQPAVPKW